MKGLLRLSNALTRVEERLLRYVEAPPHPVTVIINPRS